MNTQQTLWVVIADDESSIRNGLNFAMPWDQLGMAVAGIAKDGKEAWELVLACQPDIVITDIRMPCMTGLELMKRCRCHNLPARFIILSGYDDFSYAQAAIRYGARAYVLKPLKVEELMAELENLREEILKEGPCKDSSHPNRNLSLQPNAKKLFLNQLVQNEFRHSQDICHKLKELGLPIADSPYQVLVFSFCQTGEEEEPNVALQVQGQIEREAGDIPCCAWEARPGQVAAIVQGGDRPSFALEFAKACLESMEGLSSCQVTVGIGSQEQELASASHSYGKALAYLSYGLYEPNQVIFDETVACSQAPTLSASSIDTSPLFQAIEAHDLEAIQAYCHSYFQALLYVAMPPPSFIRGMAIYLVTDMETRLGKQVWKAGGGLGQLPYVIVNQLHTFRQIKEWTTDLFLQFAKSFGQRQEGEADQVILEAKRYIGGHMDKKVQAKDVAAHVNLSTSYFAIYFKQKTGVNFRDYVLGVKMEQAKSMLESGQAYIGQVSCAVGYDDYRSFYRAFKNYTGMTPSEYQANHQGGGH